MPPQAAARAADRLAELREREVFSRDFRVVDSCSRVVGLRVLGFQGFYQGPVKDFRV